MSEVYRKVLKRLMRDLGPDAACLYAELIDLREYRKTDVVKFNYQDAKEIGLKRYHFDAVVKKLSDAGLVERIPGSKPMVFYVKNIDGYMQNPALKVQKPAYTYAESCTSICRNQQIDMQNPAHPTYIYENYKNTVSTVRQQNEPTNNQQDLKILIFSFFADKGKSQEEAEKFIRYNLENYGEDHLTEENFEELARLWISNMKRKPKRKEDKPTYKTARQEAEARGCTVEELFKQEKPPDGADDQGEDLPEDIKELFGGAE